MTTERTPQRLLHNMSTRPRTAVSARLRSPGRAFVRFSVDDGAVLGSSSLTERLDELWREAGLRGAVHVYAFPPASVREGATVSRADPLLSINVLGRARGGLLLPGAALVLDPELLERELAADDPRLVDLAAGSWA